MRILLIALLLTAPISTQALELTLGIGTCTQAADWCHKPTGKVSLYQPIIREKAVEVGVGVDHYSRAGDGELRGKGDRGIDIISVQLRLKLI